ncbi:hypothetical protein SERLADRAFT_471566 [Serpula lacrymans var. lacrymans S7.9]|uniref:Uncharacterized protein n=1 Tax=Serpula lacrymans var. lacrymans (strain S7.9) TaxID=578457 RepID=F8P1E8_SERL9|nr:uncharacterized protein SERLADRAFT_471566 [Serpula lacrymans var. lacrymans S7.9]EGO22977.1 hypothetical protein SERLADRAFT_471566 [Serpula lacrymans var. lacrymans S7.9]
MALARNVNSTFYTHTKCKISLVVMRLMAGFQQQGSGVTLCEVESVNSWHHVGRRSSPGPK